MSQTTRYPGLTPFTAAYQSLFFGRDQDIAGLATLIQVEPLVVLHGKSGLGKSSLLNAGVLPKLQKNGLLTREVRLNSHIKGQEETPLQIFQRKLWQDLPTPHSFLDNIESESPTIWQQLKSWAYTHEGGDAGVLLVFDQFEELFTYPEGVEEFGRELASLLNGTMPRRFSRKLSVMLDEDPDCLTEAQKQFLHAPLRVGCLVFIENLVHFLSAFLLLTT